MHVNKALGSQEVLWGVKHIPWIFPMLLHWEGTSNSLTVFDIYRWEIFSKAIHRLAWVFQRSIGAERSRPNFFKVYKCLKIRVHTKRDFYKCQRVWGWRDLCRSLVCPPSQRTSPSFKVSSGPCQLLNISRDGSSTTSLRDLSQGCTTCQGRGLGTRKL